MCTVVFCCAVGCAVGCATGFCAAGCAVVVCAAGCGVGCGVGWTAFFSVSDIFHTPFMVVGGERFVWLAVRLVELVRGRATRCVAGLLVAWQRMVVVPHYYVIIIVLYRIKDKNARGFGKKEDNEFYSLS